MNRWIVTPVMLCVLGLGSWAGYRYARSRIAEEVYRDRLVSLSKDYESLRQSYNEAVKRTAVTELVVEGGKLCVAIRTAEGEVKQVPTPFDPAKEIYVDYVLVDGRLWIRRVFDADTPPQKAVVINGHYADVNWDDPRVAYGKAVYRKLGEGRWIVSVTGDGSLGLTRSDTQKPAPLSPPPPVKDYPQIERQITEEIDKIGAADVVKSLMPR